MITIGSARISENGSINGKRGDQTGKECSTQEYYEHTKGWVVLRAKGEETAKKIAFAMKGICDNDHFGYSQDDRLSGYNEAKKVGFNPTLVRTDCNVDCSEAVRICVSYAGYPVSDFYTGNEADVLVATKGFDRIENLPQDQLRIGDILVTKTKGHTAVVIESECGTWSQLSNGDWIYKVNGTLFKNGWTIVNHHWYYFNKEGIMQHGWIIINGEWFYLEETNAEGYQGACWHSDERGVQTRWSVN